MAKKAKAKSKVPPSRRQKPSQRDITVKDLRDIKHRFEALDDRMDHLVDRIRKIEEHLAVPMAAGRDAVVEPVPGKPAPGTDALE